MDHLLFLAQEHLESAQVTFRSQSERLTQHVLTLKESTSTSFGNVIENVKSRNISVKFYDWLQHIKERKANISVKLSDVYENCVYFFLTEVTRTHIYFGGMCFIFGALIGIGMGIRIRDCVVAPQKMRAVVANNYKGLEAISIIEDMNAPRIVSPDQVLIQVKAASIDYLDVKISEGYGRAFRSHLNKYNPNNWGELPVVLGRDCSGIVVSIGKDVTKVGIGDEVWLAVPVHHPGTLSEFMVVSEKFVALKPPQLSHEHAAALPYDVMRCWDVLVNQAALGEMSTAGKRILIHAGVSGIGVVAIQLLRAWGGHVTTTVNSHTQSLALMLGADDVITYDTTNFEKELYLRDKYDVIINPLGQILPEETLLPFCAPGGAVVTASYPKFASDSYGFFMGILYTVFIRLKYYFIHAPWVTGGKLGTLEISGEVLERVAPLIATGHLRPLLDKTYSAQDAEFAFQYITRGETVGKTIIRFSEITPSRNLEMTFWQDL